MKGRKSKSFNRFQHICAEYCSFHRTTIKIGMERTLSAIAHFLNARTLCCFPSFDTIADYAGMSRSAIIRNINRLVASGIVSKTPDPLPRGGYKNVYRISFITSDFPNKPGWRKRPLSRTQESSTNTINTYVNNVTTTTTDITNTNRQESVVGAHKKPISKIQPSFKWLEKVPYRCENPMQAFCDITQSSFSPAYFPGYDDGKEFFDIPESVLTETEQAKILKSPVECAIAITGEYDNLILKRFLFARCSQLGKKRIAGEVMSLLAQIKQERDNKEECNARPKKRIHHKGKLLVSRINQCLFLNIASKGLTQSPDWQLLWDVAEGIKPMPTFKAA